MNVGKSLDRLAKTAVVMPSFPTRAYPPSITTIAAGTLLNYIHRHAVHPRTTCSPATAKAASAVHPVWNQPRPPAAARPRTLRPRVRHQQPRRPTALLQRPDYPSSLRREKSRRLAQTIPATAPTTARRPRTRNAIRRRRAVWPFLDMVPQINSNRMRSRTNLTHVDASWAHTFATVED